MIKFNQGTLTMAKANCIVSRTRDLLLNRPRTLTSAKISKATKIPASFIDSVVADTQREFSARRIQTLFEYMSGRQLDVA